MHEQKAEIVNIRVTPEIRMRLDEIAEATGVTRGGFVRMCVDKVMSMMYDSEGYLMDFSKIGDRGKLNELDGYFRVGNVSTAYGIPYTTISSAVRSGRVRSFKRGGSTYVRLSDVLRMRG